MSKTSFIKAAGSFASKVQQRGVGSSFSALHVDYVQPSYNASHSLTTAMPKVPIETTYLFRDQSQSGYASALEQRAIEAAPYINRMKPTDGRKFRVEVHSGMSADAECRTIGSNVFKELEKFNAALDPAIDKQILFRVLVGGYGYQPVAPDVTAENIRINRECGVTDIRPFDALNSLDNHAPAIEASLKYGLKVHIAYCFTKTDNDVQAKRFWNFLEEAYTRYGNSVDIDIKDMSAGMQASDVVLLMNVATAFRQAHPEAVNFVQIGKHSHSEQGYTDEANIMFLKQGGRRLDLSSDLIGTHGGLVTTAQLLQGTPYDLGINIEAAKELEAFWQRELPLFEPFKTKYPDNIQQLARYSQAPGGSFGSTYARLNAMGLGHKMPAVLEAMGNIRKELDNVALVTPVALFVTQQALQEVLSGSKRPTKDIQNLVAGDFGPLENVDPTYQAACMKARIEDAYAGLKKPDDKKLDAKTLAAIAGELYAAGEQAASQSVIAKQNRDIELLLVLRNVLLGKASDRNINALLEISPTLKQAVENEQLSRDDCRKLLASGTRNRVIPPVELLPPGLAQAGEELLAFAKEKKLTIYDFDEERALWASLKTGNPLDMPFQKFLELREQHDPFLFPGSIASLEARQKEPKPLPHVAMKPEPFKHSTANYIEPVVKWDEAGVERLLGEIVQVRLGSLTPAIIRDIIYKDIEHHTGYGKGSLDAKEAVGDAIALLSKKAPAIRAVLKIEPAEQHAKTLRQKRDFVREAVGDHLIVAIGAAEAERFLGTHSAERNTPEQMETIHIRLELLQRQAESKLEKALQSNQYGSISEREVTKDPLAIREVFHQVKMECYKASLKEMGHVFSQSQGRAA